MTATMAQQGLDLPPASRQDIISALLDDYAMGRSDASPFEFSPVPALKELPPPPPEEREGNVGSEKPLPPVGHMSMRFQLRVDEPASPESPDGSRSSLDSQPRRIVSRSMSRGSKPPSLKLLASNGSTAALPPTPALPSSTPTPVTASRLPQEEEKSLPPPPPAKSERRQSLKNRPAPERPTRYDSLVDREEKVGPQIAGPVKRKPVPKFTSLADLGNGPRGGKGGPLPQPRARKQSVEREQESSKDDLPATAVEAKIVDIPERSSKSSTKSQDRDVSPPRPAPPMISQLPPTPDEKPSPLPPPKKPFAGMGLPSNPRAKGQETPKHVRGKSSTGFDLMMKNAKPAPTQHLNTITPGPTPSPNTIEQIQQERSPVSPIENSEQRRPFSFESIAPPPPPQKSTQPGPASARPASPISPLDAPANPAQFPPRSTSRAPAAFANLPSQQRSATPEERATSPEDELSPPTPTTPIFTPLTVKPEPSAAPAITPKHMNCYLHHSTFVWSKNEFQPMACMVCHSNDRERKWACVWCYLRICVGCSEELLKTPGRDLRKVMEKRGVQPVLEKVDSRHDSGTGANPSVVVWGAEEDYGGRGYGGRDEDDFS